MYEKLSVYIVAHQDDWQLFMDPNISRDLIDTTCKTIVIHTTAGDAGNDQKFWKAREAGAINSILFRINKASSNEPKEESICLLNKKLQVTHVGNCSIYSLRLPDGGMYGEGFDMYNFCSLSKIRQNRIPKISTVDGENEFQSFQEISDLLNEILAEECRINQIPETQIVLNLPEPNLTINPEDHNDHFNTALLIQQTALYHSARKYAFVHYDIRNSGAGLVGEDLFWKLGMFCIYHQTVLEMNGYSTIDESPLYKVWCTKNAVYREIS